MCAFQTKHEGYPCKDVDMRRQNKGAQTRAFRLRLRQARKQGYPDVRILD